MACTTCKSPLEDTGGGVPFRNCPHILCWECLQTCVKETPKRNIKCPTNAGKRKIGCYGFLDSDDIKSIVPEETYEIYCRRTMQATNNCTSLPTEVELEPSSSSSSAEPDNLFAYHSQGLQMSQVSSNEPQFVPFEEMNLSEEEKQSGWGQMAKVITELMTVTDISFSEASGYVDRIPLWVTICPTHCPICLSDEIPSGEGVILKDCLHIFCRNCLARNIEVSEDPEVRCPYNDGEYACTSFLKSNEIRALVSKKEYEKHYDELSLKEAEKILQNVFHCLTANCTGFCTYDENAALAGSMIFQCPKCRRRNCLPCAAIHDNGGCAGYWQNLEDEQTRARQRDFDATNRIVQRQNEQISENMIKGNLNHRVFMRCPKCNIPCYKFTGCNHVTCSSCKHKFDWAGTEPNSFT